MELADHALVQWPALQLGCTPKQALSQVKSKIQWRVRNEKRPTSSGLETSKRVNVHPSQRKSKAPRYENFEGYQAYLPPAPEEDIQRFRNLLKGEVPKEERASLISTTFPDRRQHAVALRTPMRKLLQLYPILRDSDEIWCELERLCGKSASRLDEYRRRLDDFLTAVQLLTNCDDEDRVDSLLEYLTVKVEEIFGEEAHGAPHYDEGADGRLRLIVEGHCIVPSLNQPKSDLLLLWAAVYPVFNQRCPRSSAKNALVFLTEHVLEKNGGNCVLGNRVLARIQKLTKMTE